MKKAFNLYKPNQYIFNDNNTVSIIITNRKGVEYETLIDTEDFERVSQHSWRVAFNKRAKWINTMINGKNVKMHRFLMNMTNPEIKVDHINTNPFINIKSNLRICIHRQNSYNTKLRKNNTSGYKGVFNLGNKFRASIKYNGKTFYLGTYLTPEDAHEAYCKKGKEFFGEFFNPGY